MGLNWGSTGAQLGLDQDSTRAQLGLSWGTIKAQPEEAYFQVLLTLSSSLQIINLIIENTYLTFQAKILSLNFFSI